MPAASYFPLPVTVEGVTAKWLTQALRQRTPGVTIRKAEVVDTIFHDLLEDPPAARP
jgi:hypothetical protein